MQTVPHPHTAPMGAGPWSPSAPTFTCSILTTGQMRALGRQEGRDWSKAPQLGLGWSWSRPSRRLWHLHLLGVIPLGLRDKRVNMVRTPQWAWLAFINELFLYGPTPPSL